MSCRAALPAALAALGFAALAAWRGDPSILIWYGPLLAGLAVCTAEDVRTRLVPGWALWALLAAGCVLAALQVRLVWTQALLGAAVTGGALLAALALGVLLTGQQALGGGDIKLAVCAGLLLGVRDGLLGLLIAVVTCALGVLAWRVCGRNVRKDDHLPFVPFLSFGWAVSGLFGAQMVCAYLRMIDAFVARL